MAEQTFQSTKDSYIRSTGPTTNAGSSSSLIYGQASTSSYRTPIAFDVSSMPSGSVVKYAYLDLTVSTSVGAGETFELRRLTKDWTELEVTWNEANSGDSWSTAGGDFVEELGVDFTLPAVGDTAINVTALVQDAFDNRGGNVNLIIKSASETTPNHYNVARSRDFATAADRPKLVVEYDLSPYVEIRESLTFNNSSANTWQEKDILTDFGIPDEAILEIMMTNDSQTAENNAGIRTSGSSVSRLWDLHEAEGGGVDAVSAHVKMTNGVIETYSESTTNVEFTILGYWKPGSCDFVEVGLTSITVTNNATWEDYDLSSVGIADGDVAEIHFYNGDGASEYEGGAREVGSTLDRKVDIHEPEGGGRDWAGMLVKASGSDGTIQVYLENDARLRGLVYGYFPAESLPGEWTEKFESITDAVFAGGWEQKTESDIPNPSEAESGVTLHAMLTNTSSTAAHFMGIRDPNSNHNRYVELQEAESGGEDHVSMHVHISGQQYDIWTDFASATDPKMLGYWLTAKPTGVASGDLDLFIHGHDDTSPRLYWITDDSDIIGQSRLDGSNSGVLATFSSFAQPGKLANDKDPKRPVYYILTTDQNLFEIDDEGNTTPIYSTGFSDKGIEVDHAKGIVIFSEDATVTSGALDGSASGTLFDDNTILNPIDAIELDLIGGNIYYIYNDSFLSKQHLYRRDYPVIGDREQIYFNQDNSRVLTDFVVSVGDGKIYVLESDFFGPTSRVRSMNLDGSDVTTIWTKSTNSMGIGIHAQSRSLFVGATTTNTIVRVDMDTGAETTILDDTTAGTDDPRDIIVQPDWATSLFIHGHQPSSGDIDLYIEGTTPSSGDIDLFVHGHASTDTGGVYFSDSTGTPDYIDRIFRDGSNRNTFAEIDTPRGMSQYVESGSIYVGHGLITKEILDVSIENGDIQTQFVDAGSSGIAAVEVDRTNDRLYWSVISSSGVGQSQSTVFRIDLDGSNFQTLIVSDVGIEEIAGIGVDADNNHLYLADSSDLSNDSAIKRTDLDGNGITTIVTMGSAYIEDLTIDHDRELVYFVTDSAASGQIRSIDFGASTLTSIVTENIVSPKALVYDKQTDRIFWVEQGGTTSVKSCKTDGSDIQTLVSSDFNTAVDIEVVPDKHVSLVITGYEPASGNIDCFIRGCETASGQLDCTITGHDVVSGDLDCFIHGCETISGQIDCTIIGDESASGDMDLYIGGASGASGDIPCFIHGCETVSGQIDCTIIGKETASGDLDCFIHGCETVSGQIDCTITGHQTVSGDLDCFIHGCETVSGQLDCTITGSSGVSGGMDLFIQGKPSGDIDLYIGGASGTSGDMDLFIKGKPSGDMDLFIGGSSGVSGDIDLFIKGKPSGDIDLYIGGVSGVSGDIDLFIQGTPSGDIPLFIDGEGGATDDLDLFIKGKPSGQMDLFIGGASGASGDLDLFIQGKPSGDIPLFIDGEGAVSGDLDLFIKGKPSGDMDLFIGGASGVSGSIPLFVSGALGTSGDVSLVIIGKESASGDIDLFIQGTPSGDLDLFIGGSSGVSGDLDLFIGGISGISGDITLVIIGEGPASGNIPLFIKGQPSGDLDLVIVGSSGASGVIDLYISGPSGASGELDLVLTGSGIIPFSGQLDLFIHGLIEKPALSCPIPLETDAFQVTNELIDIYQNRIDAMINQIGKNVILDFDPVKEVCPNCHFDPQRNRSSGRPKSGGPRPFIRGRECPYCKGRGFVETPQQRCIKALVKWNPRDLATYRISVRGRKAIVRLKTLLADAVHLERAKTLVVDPDQSSMVIFRVKKIKGPVMRGLREDRYAVSFWELL